MGLDALDANTSIDEWIRDLRKELIKAIAVSSVTGLSLLGASFLPIFRPLLQSTVTVSVALVALGFLLALLLGGIVAYFAFKPSIEALKSLASTDELTKLYNNREFMRRLDAEIKRATRYSLPLSMALIDLDGFKSINDTHGYEAGDSALKEFAEIVRREIRDTDIAFRYKMGDEFAIIFPNTELVSARVPAERLRGRVEQYRFTIPGRSSYASLTMCAGIVSLLSSHDSVEDIPRQKSKSEDFSLLVADGLRGRAEKSLAQAKLTKNSVVMDGVQ